MEIPYVVHVKEEEEDRFNVFSIDNVFVKEQALVYSFSSSFRSPRPGTKKCFWTLKALLEVGDIQNTLK